MKNRILLRIAGQKYTLMADESVEYMNEVASFAQQVIVSCGLDARDRAGGGQSGRPVYQGQARGARSGGKMPQARGRARGAPQRKKD